MTTKNSKNLNFVNASGYLFQLKIAAIVNNFSKECTRRQLHLLATEHRWADEETGLEGFIDLVMETGTNGRLVIECKRIKGNGKWVFLVPQKQAQESGASRILWTGKDTKGRPMAAWDGFHHGPDSLTSSFCIVRGSGESDPPYLERIASILIRATESLANEEISFIKERSTPGLRFYFPTIITNANLVVCKYDHEKIDTSTGELDEGDFQSVPMIRFTKSLSSRVGTSFPSRNILVSGLESERTIFVINSDELINILKREWEFRGPDHYKGWPWESSYWTPGNGE